MDPGNIPSASAGEDDEPGRPTWTSGLTVDEFACLRAAGFTPVGQVMGAAVYKLDPGAVIELQNRRIEWLNGSDQLRFPPRRERYPELVTEARTAQRRLHDADRRLGYTTDPTRHAAHEVFDAACRQAMNAMRAECRGLRGDGIVAVHLETGPFQGQEHTLALRLTGTAVRAHGFVHPGRPFSSDLSVQEFTKLLGAGWVPVELVVGATIGRLFEPRSVRRQRRRFARNQEIRRWSKTVTFLRGQARYQLRQDADATGADGVVISSHDLRLYEHAGERFAEARFVGTAIAAFGDPTSRLERSLADRLLSMRAFPPAPASRTTSILRLETPEDGPDATGTRRGPIR